MLGAFYTGAVFSSYMTNYSESYIEDLTVDSTLKQQEGFQRVNIKKKSKSCKPKLLSQNAGFKLFNSPLWKRVIAWERSRAASGYGIIWGEADGNKQEEFSAECHSLDCF